MSEVIECVYEGGVLKPFEKINLKENTRVRVTIKPKLNLRDFVMAELPEGKIRELEERFESEDRLDVGDQAYVLDALSKRLVESINI